METCFILWTGVSGVITFLNERNRNKKTQVLIQTTQSLYIFLSEP